MQEMLSKITSRSQGFVPIAVRSFLQLSPGSVLDWKQDGDLAFVERARRHTTAEVHEALFSAASLPNEAARTLAELKPGVPERIRCRHACR